MPYDPGMSPIVHRPLLLLWSLFYVVWLGAALRGKRVARRESLLLGLSHRLWLVPAIWLMFFPVPAHGILSLRLLPDVRATVLVGEALLAAGIGFAFWARLALGANWSGTVTIKEGHELVRTGPYAIARHPIYTGFLLAMLGTAVVAGTLGALLGWGLVIVSFWRKSRIEEQWMREQFGEAYARYADEVRALIPYVW